MVSVQPTTYIEASTVRSDIQKPVTGVSQAERINQVVILEETSVLKGIFWGWLGLNCCQATLVGIVGTLLSGATLVESFSYQNRGPSTEVCALGLMGASLLTLAFGGWTKQCADNCFYHFGPRQVRVIQLSN